MSNATMDHVAIASEIMADNKAGLPMRSYAQPDQRSVDNAYAVQDAFVEMLLSEGRGPVRGHKIALTSAAMQAMVGVDHPLAGVIVEDKVHQSGFIAPLKNYQHIGLEFEVAVEIGSPLSGADVDRAAVEKVVSSVRPAFEIVEDRRADYDTLEAFSLIAENAWNAGNVLGEPVSPVGLDLSAAVTILEVNGVEEERAVTGAAMGHPFEAVAWMARLLHSRGRRLEAGEFVMTGSSMKTRFPVAGDQYRYTIEGMGSVELNVQS